jgi:hypothetical protein
MRMPAWSTIFAIAFGRLSHLRVSVQVNFCDDAALHAAQSLGALLLNSRHHAKSYLHPAFYRPS